MRSDVAARRFVWRGVGAVSSVALSPAGRWLTRSRTMDSSTNDGATFFHVRAYPLAMRLGAGWLLAASGLALPFLLVRILIANDPPMSEQMVLRAFIATSALPALAALFIQRALRGELEFTGGDLVVRVGGQIFAVPVPEITAVEPWRVPLPMPGFRLRLASS